MNKQKVKRNRLKKKGNRELGIAPDQEKDLVPCTDPFRVSMENELKRGWLVFRRSQDLPWQDDSGQVKCLTFLCLLYNGNKNSSCLTGGCIMKLTKVSFQDSSLL